jgi:AcrR family transcriptional regulator
MAQMSHREKLLEGAIECLQNKGYARTTARDIAAAANANLASIGYHFGSKDALLNEAILRAGEHWNERIGAAVFAGRDRSAFGQMAASWSTMLDSIEELRPVLVGFIEAVGQSAWSDDLRHELAGHYRTWRSQVGEMVRRSINERTDEADIDPDVIASFLIAVCDGFVLQWLVDPDATPSGEELTASLGAVFARSLSQPAA